MGIMSFAEDSTPQDDETEQEAHSDVNQPSGRVPITEVAGSVGVGGFLHQYDDRTGKYRGPDPPSIFETNTLEEHWHELWVDKTGDWEDSRGISDVPDKEFVKTECPCGSTVIMPLMSRWTRCSDCARVLVNREWEDSRVDNPNLKQERGIDDWL